MQNYCYICLKYNNHLKNLDDITSDNKKIITKLESCIPEVDWKIDYLICSKCIDQLTNVFNFRLLCISSDLARKNRIVKDEIKTEIKVEETVLLEGPKEEFICFHCNHKANSKTNLIQHIQTAHSKNYEIDEEDVDDTSFKNINMCSSCGNTFSNKSRLTRHVKNVHAVEKKFKCEVCDRCFASPVYLKAHKIYHSGERKHICSFCGKGYITASDLSHHEKTHRNKRSYRCDRCPKAFNTSSDLSKHKICVHVDRSKWKYECPMCQRRFPLKTNLNNHLRTHTGEKNFQCHLCDNKFGSKAVLQRHIVTHSTVRKFNCHVCFQCYKHQRSLDLHLAKVHKIGNMKIPEHIKRFFCTICPKSYFENCKLQKHIRTHTGERPFKCTACNKSFIDKSYIKQHMKTVHNIVQIAKN